MNSPHFHFILLNFKFFSEIVTLPNIYQVCFTHTGFITLHTVLLVHALGKKVLFCKKVKELAPKKISAFLLHYF